MEGKMEKLLFSKQFSRASRIEKNSKIAYNKTK